MPHQYTRKRHIITDASGAVIFTGKCPAGHRSINAAKRESRRLQAGALGQGRLRVSR